MTNALSKPLKFSFGANNFTSSKPSNGTYLRLILTSLSKKGNWGSLFQKLSALSINSRQNSNSQLTKTSANLNPLTIYSNSLNSSNNNGTSLKQAANALINSSLSNFEIRRIKNRSLFIVKNEKAALYKKENILTSLRLIYSLFHPLLVSIELKSKRRGGRVFSVPVPVKSDKRRHSIFIRWFKQSLVEQKGLPLSKFLINELYQLSLREGKSMDRLIELDKTIKLNRVFLRKSQIKLI